MQAIVEKWLKIAVFNLCIVALWGIILRYKIAFPLPFIDQKNLLRGHSHFAFSGWITMALMVLLVYYLYKMKQENLVKRYSWIFVANLVVSYITLISFSIQGYSFISILFSTLSLFLSYIFAIRFWKDLNKLNVNRNSHLWFKAALLFNVISSIGPYCLAFMVAGNMINSKVYLSSVYYYLHFQYNGWFIFACLGLFISKLYEVIGEEKRYKTIFWIFALSCVPSYFLSALWLQIPNFIYIVVVIAAVMQLFAWIWFVRIIHSHISTLKKAISNPVKLLMALAAISMSIKLVLQLGSAYLPINQLSFGFRPIIIGYLHLVLLGVISVFILGFIISEKMLVMNRTITIGISIFVSGVFINEILLMVQGIFALATESVPYINNLLLVAAIIMFTGLIVINIKTFLKSYS